MKTSFQTILVGLFVVAACAAAYYLASDSTLPSKPQTSSSGRASVPAPKSASAPAPVQSSPNLPASTKTVELESAGASSPANGTIEQRLAALEALVNSLQQALAGVSLEKASAERNALFAAEEGYLKADEYFEAGKFAIAGEGYLTFLKNHPQHADARDVMKKARDAFLKAGYKDKAFWVQEEMMKGNPQHQLADLEELAHIEKNAGLYDRAIEHMNQAAQLDPNPESRLWKRMYWAWFVQLQEGNAAGLQALQQVRQEIAGSGVTNPKLTERVDQHMREWQQQLVRNGPGQ